MPRPDASYYQSRTITHKTLNFCHSFILLILVKLNSLPPTATPKTQHPFARSPPNLTSLSENNSISYDSLESELLIQLDIRKHLRSLPHTSPIHLLNPTSPRTPTNSPQWPQQRTTTTSTSPCPAAAAPAPSTAFLRRWMVRLSPLPPTFLSPFPSFPLSPYRPALLTLPFPQQC